MGGSQLSESQLAKLTELIVSAGSLELPVLVRAFAAGKTHEIGVKLIAALEQAPGRQSLSARELDTIWKSYPPSVSAAAASLSRQLTVTDESQAAKLRSPWSAMRWQAAQAMLGRKKMFLPRTGSPPSRTGDSSAIGPDL